MGWVPGSVRGMARADVIILAVVDAKGAEDRGENLGGADLAFGDGAAILVVLAIKQSRA